MGSVYAAFKTWVIKSNNSLTSKTGGGGDPTSRNQVGILWVLFAPTKPGSEATHYIKHAQSHKRGSNFKVGVLL